MSPKKLRGSKAKTAVPEWSQKIMNFRNSLKLSQSELAKRLGSSAMGVSRWERGTQEPPPISLAFLSSPSMLELRGNQSTTMSIWSK